MVPICRVKRPIGEELQSKVRSSRHLRDFRGQACRSTSRGLSRLVKTSIRIPVSVSQYARSAWQEHLRPSATGGTARRPAQFGTNFPANHAFSATEDSMRLEPFFRRFRGCGGNGAYRPARVCGTGGTNAVGRGPALKVIEKLHACHTEHRTVPAPARAVGRIPDITQERHHLLQWVQSNRIRQVPKPRRLLPAITRAPADVRREKATRKGRREKVGQFWTPIVGQFSKPIDIHHVRDQCGGGIRARSPHRAHPGRPSPRHGRRQASRSAAPPFRRGAAVGARTPCNRRQHLLARPEVQRQPPDHHARERWESCPGSGMNRSFSGSAFSHLIRANYHG